MRRALGTAAAVTALAIGLAGCGSADAPSAADQLPSLRASLSKVDDALAAHRFTVAKKLLRQLIAETKRAGQSGDLEPATADDIVGAAQRLLTDLGTGASAPKPTTSTKPSASPKHDKPTSTAKPSQQPTGRPSSEPTQAPPTPQPSTPAPPTDPTPTSNTNPVSEKSPAPTAQATP